MSLTLSTAFTILLIVCGVIIAIPVAVYCCVMAISAMVIIFSLLLVMGVNLFDCIHTALSFTFSCFSFCVKAPYYLFNRIYLLLKK